MSELEEALVRVFTVVWKIRWHYLIYTVYEDTHIHRNVFLLLFFTSSYFTSLVIKATDLQTDARAQPSTRYHSEYTLWALLFFINLD